MANFREGLRVSLMPSFSHRPPNTNHKARQKNSRARAQLFGFGWLPALCGGVNPGFFASICFYRLSTDRISSAPDDVTIGCRPDEITLSPTPINKPTKITPHGFSFRSRQKLKFQQIVRSKLKYCIVAIVVDNHVAGERNTRIFFPSLLQGRISCQLQFYHQRPRRTQSSCWSSRMAVLVMVSRMLVPSVTLRTCWRPHRHLLQ